MFFSFFYYRKFWEIKKAGPTSKKILETSTTRTLMAYSRTAESVQQD